MHLFILQLSKIILQSLIKPAYKSNKSHEKFHNKYFDISTLMIKLQGIAKLQNCSENSSLADAKNDIEMNTFINDIEIFEDMSINI